MAETIKVSSIGSHRRLTVEYINEKCRRLVDERYYSCLDTRDLERMLKFMRQRKLYHRIEFDQERAVYSVVVQLPFAEPVNISSTDKNLSMAVSLCGMKLAEMAEL